MENLEAVQAAWSKQRTERLNFINEKLQKERQTFDDVDQAMKQYYYITGQDLSNTLPSNPKFSDFYTPSPDQHNREIVLVMSRMTATGFVGISC